MQCGEKYYSDEVMEKIEDIISHAKQIASEVVVTDYNKNVACGRQKGEITYDYIFHRYRQQQIYS